MRGMPPFVHVLVQNQRFQNDFGKKAIRRMGTGPTWVGPAPRCGHPGGRAPPVQAQAGARGNQAGPAAVCAAAWPAAGCAAAWLAADSAAAWPAAVCAAAWPAAVCAAAGTAAVCATAWPAAGLRSSGACGCPCSSMADGCLCSSMACDHLCINKARSCCAATWRTLLSAKWRGLRLSAQQHGVR